MAKTSYPKASEILRRTSWRLRDQWIWILALLVILGAGAYLRLTGIFWGDYSFLHPDERFFVWVTADVSPVKSLSEYFNTAISTLNPHNVGHTFFVYGTFPVIVTRYLADAIFNVIGWNEILQVGRVFSAVMDLTTVFLVYLLGTRLFNRKIGVLGAAFSAFAVMQIQQSHFYTADSFSTTFTTLALYFAARLATQPVLSLAELVKTCWYKGEAFRNSLWFGIAIGLAMACKINTALMAVLLPAAWFIYILRHPRDERDAFWGLAIGHLVIGGAAAFLIFRIFQPYAFSGPGFFGLIPNEKWIANLRELASQMTGNVDFPPALQWARRPVTFSFTNMVTWGMGLAMGILAWAGFIWMGIRQLNGMWKRSLLVWGWTAIYFVWQSLQGNPTMRYELPIYPTLALIAGWALWNLWDLGNRYIDRQKLKNGRWLKIAAVLTGVITIGATLAWAFAFSRIYTRSLTRLEGSRWVMQNVPGPVTLEIASASGINHQPLTFSSMQALRSGVPLTVGLTAQTSGILSSVELTGIQDLSANPNSKTLQVFVYEEGSTIGGGFGVLVNNFPYSDLSLLRWVIPLDQPLTVQSGHRYKIEIHLVEPDMVLGISGSGGVSIQTLSGTVHQVLAPFVDTVRMDQPQEIRFGATKSGSITRITMPHVVDVTATAGIKSLKMTLAAETNLEKPLAVTEIVNDFSASGDPRGRPFVWTLDQQIPIVAGEQYSLRMELITGGGAIALNGDAIAIETPWDDSVPFRADGYDPFAGIYQGDLNFEMYWDDSPDKLARFESVLDRADYVTISSNRQWGTTTRVPERYPLTTVYYRELMGCPAAMELLTCYRDAQVGTFKGRLGFELIKVFQSNPNLGSFQINDQYAEEAFTVYDHPKVFVFKKTADYSLSRVQQTLGAVDLSTVIHVIPGQAKSYPADLLMPSEMTARQQAGGTWAEIFNTDAFINRYPGVGAVVWYFAIFLIGAIIYPFLRIAMKGLPDLGYPLAKMAGLLLLTWMVWMAGSNSIAFSRVTIWAAAVVLAIGSLTLAWWRRDDFRQEIKQRWCYYLTVEAVGLAFFLLFLAVRLGNPDLWHPNYGGEKPMDFAYFNAVIKSTTFPPYNPWYAGAWINYYYYGFVIAAVPIKWLGIVPSVAYNLLLPTFFSLVALGAYSFGWNVQKWLHNRTEYEAEKQKLPSVPPWIAGLISAVGMLILGNLGTLRMIWHGVMKLAAPGGVIDGSNLITRIGWTVQGLGQYISGVALPYSPGDWYWIPSRAVKGGDAITEFPFFTFLYGDPHAHMFALPITLLALGWALSLVLGKWRWKIGERVGGWLPFTLSVFLGAVTIGSLRPTNTWDLPTYLGLALAAIIYTTLRYAEVPKSFLPGLSPAARRLTVAFGSVLLLGVLSFVLYQPYQNWYAQGYSKFAIWTGEKTRLWDYFTHWGLFLVIIVVWLFRETIEWLEQTPVSALNKLRPVKSLLAVLATLFVVVILFLTLRQKVGIAWLTVTLAVWALVLILRPGQPDAKRAVLFMIGTAAVLTLAVEVVVLVGDINRMNTVFKFYLQAWTLFSLSAAASLFWLIPQVELKWKAGWRTSWSVAVGALVFCALLYPVTAGPAKIRDRISPTAPHTLDGMAYMQTATYYDQNGPLDLNNDFRAIRWLQENVIGSPVIVEANTPEYRWGSRISIYTGLPATIGWNWHQRQQRASIPDTSVWARIDEITAFYNTTNLEQARNFLQKYNVKYIIVGQLEHLTYDAAGIAKYPAYSGQFWRPVYQDGITTIYEVIQ